MEKPYDDWVSDVLEERRERSEFAERVDSAVSLCRTVLGAESTSEILSGESLEFLKEALGGIDLPKDTRSPCSGVRAVLGAIEDVIGTMGDGERAQLRSALGSWAVGTDAVLSESYQTAASRAEMVAAGICARIREHPEENFGNWVEDLYGSADDTGTLLAKAMTHDAASRLGCE